MHWENLTGLTTKLRQIYVLPIDDATYGKSIRIAYEFEDICSENGSVIPITLLSQPVNKIDSSNDMSDIDKALDADKEWLTINAFKAYVWKWYAWNDKIHTVLSQTRPHTGGQLVPVNLGQS